MGMRLPGAAESEPRATVSRSGTRCSTALTVVSTICGLSARLADARQRRHAPRDDGRMRRDAVVRQAVPGGELDRLDPGREEAEPALDLGQPLAVAGDEEQPPRAGRG